MNRRQMRQLVRRSHQGMRLAATIWPPDQPFRSQPGQYINIKTFGNTTRVYVVTCKALIIRNRIENEVVPSEAKLRTDALNSIVAHTSPSYSSDQLVRSKKYPINCWINRVSALTRMPSSSCIDRVKFCEPTNAINGPPADPGSRM